MNKIGIMEKMYLLQVVDNSIGKSVGSMKGTALQLSTQLQTVLEDLPRSHWVRIVEADTPEAVANGGKLF